MTYDNEGRLATWTAPSGTTASDSFLYDNEGNRVLQRISDSNGITDTITFDGYTEKVINGSTTTTSKFYTVNAMRLALRQASTLYYLLPDLLGSPTVALNSDGSFQAVQLFNPYGSSRYSSGSMPTDYSFTGQRLDSETGLIYDNFRYYDPVSGRFTRADTVDTNAKGMDGYGYVGDNPEGRTDPTGHCWPLCTMIIGALIGAAVSVATTAITSAVQGKPPTAGQLLQAAAVGAVTGAITGLVGPEAGPIARVAVGAIANGAGQMVGNALSGKPLMDGVAQAAITGAITGGIMEGVGALMEGISSETTAALEDAPRCSFTFDTRVTTAHGKQAIGTLHVGDKVLAYNPQTHQMELQPILHVWINHDNDLVDLTLTTTLKTRQRRGVSRQREVIHTNKKHPFFTKEQGFLSVGQIKLGMHVLRADGLWGLVTGWKIVPGSMTMYNLEVAYDHTFTVGDGQWIVHNSSPSCLIGSYSDVRQAISDNPDEYSGYQAHHIYQHAMMNTADMRAAGYTYEDAPAIALEGGTSVPGSEHWWTWKVQNAANAGFRAAGRTSLTFEEATDVARRSLIAAGYTGPDLDYIMDFAQGDFENNYSPSLLNSLRVLR